MSIDLTRIRHNAIPRDRATWVADIRITLTLLATSKLILWCGPIYAINNLHCNKRSTSSVYWFKGYHLILECIWYSSQQTQNICTSFVLRRPNVFDVDPTFYKCYTNVLRWLSWRLTNVCGCQVMQHIWIDPLCILFFNHFFTQTRIKNGEFSIS